VKHESNEVYEGTRDERGGGGLPAAGAATTVDRMSMFRVNVVACNPKQEERATPPIEVLVDTGAELTWLPGEILANIGIQPRRKRTIQTATEQVIEREVGYAILRAEGFETNDEVVFAQPTDLHLLGIRTIEGFGVMVDNIAHRFVATTTLVASAIRVSAKN
jgi:predicted aspartyl protease